MSRELVLRANKFIVDNELPADSLANIIELVADIERGRHDIKFFAKRFLGIDLNAFQEVFLVRSTTPRKELVEQGLYMGGAEGMTYGKNIATPSNQIGKTVMTAVKHIWFNYYKNGLDLDAVTFDKVYYATLNISPQTRQTRACSNYIQQILKGEFAFELDGVKQLNEVHPILKDFIVGFNNTTGEMRFANGAIMYSVPVGHDQAASLAGGQYAYISYDECAQSHHLKEELGAKILSRLIKYGQCLDLISTFEVDAPSHQYYQKIARDGAQHKDGWWQMGGKLQDNKFISEDQQRKIMADLLSVDKKKYRQVVFGEAVTGGKRFFDQAEIDQMWTLTGPQPCVPGHKYLQIADWGMADTGDPSVFYILDYTNFMMGGNIEVVARESMQGGTPNMQFAVLRVQREAYTYDMGDGTQVPPRFLMDAAALGGVVIKKMLRQLSPIGHDIEKDEALLLLKNELSHGRDYYEEEDGRIVERVLQFGKVKSFFIQELADQLGNYHLDDGKLTQDEVMTLMMGVAYIVKKVPRYAQKKIASFGPLGGWNGRIQTNRPVRRGHGSEDN